MIDVVHKKISILMFEINILNYYVFIMMIKQVSPQIISNYLLVE